MIGYHTQARPSQPQISQISNLRRDCLHLRWHHTATSASSHNLRRLISSTRLRLRFLSDSSVFGLTPSQYSCSSTTHQRQSLTTALYHPAKFTRQKAHFISSDTATHSLRTLSLRMPQTRQSLGNMGHTTVGMACIRTGSPLPSQQRPLRTGSPARLSGSPP